MIRNERMDFMGMKEMQNYWSFMIFLNIILFDMLFVSQIITVLIDLL